MTSVAIDQSRRVQVPGVTQLRVLRSEWTKFRSLRSTMWTLLVALTLLIGIGALVSAVTASHYADESPSDKASFSAIGTSLSGITFAQLAIGVLGVLLISGEYSTGMIRSSLTVVPRRLPVLWGKLSVFAVTIFPLGLAASFASFVLGQAILSGKSLDVTLGSSGAVRSVFGAAAYLMLAGLIGVALGAVLRNTAAGISTFVGVFFVIPPITNLLPTSVSDSITPYLPSDAGASMFNGAGRIHSALSPGAGFAVLLGYAVVLIGAAAWRLRTADA